MNNVIKSEKKRMYDERCLERWEDAKKQIEKMYSNDELLNLFKQQLECRENRIVDQVDEIIEKLRNETLPKENHEGHLAFLQVSYVSCMVFICDSSCEYNPDPRMGQRKYTKPRKFFCELIKQDTNQSKPPEWLDLEKNICSDYYVDLSK